MESGAVAAVCVLVLILLGGFGFICYYLSDIACNTRRTAHELTLHRQLAERLAAKPMKLPGE